METVKRDAEQVAECPEQRDDELRIADSDSAAIRRLIDEIRSDEPALVGGHYDRVHNRHNR